MKQLSEVETVLRTDESINKFIHTDLNTKHSICAEIAERLNLIDANVFRQCPIYWKKFIDE